MKTLYLHIGTPKTGTTAIQKFCESNSELLEQQGYCYPILPYVYPDCSIRRNALFLHQKIYLDGVRDREEEENRFREGMNTVIQLFEKYDNVILSDESIWRGCYENRKTLWKDLKAIKENNNFVIKIIVYLRRQDTYIESHWNQYVKGPVHLSETFEQYCTRIGSSKRFKYYEMLSEIASVFGESNVIVRRFERDHFPDGLIQYDFLQAIGVRITDEYELTFDTANLRLSGNTHEIKRIVNTLPDLKGSDNTHFRNVTVSYSELSGNIYPNNMFSPEEARAFVDTFLEGNRKIAEKYLDEKDSDLFDMTFKEIPKWKKNNPYFLDDVIRFAGESYIWLFDKIDNLEEESKILCEETAILSKDIKEQFNSNSGLKEKFKHPIRTFFCFLLKRNTIELSDNQIHLDN